jgi:hypothetical protein
MAGTESDTGARLVIGIAGTAGGAATLQPAVRTTVNATPIECDDGICGPPAAIETCGD